MAQNLEKLNTELIQAQLLLRASHDLYQDILIETARHRLMDGGERRSHYRREIDRRIAKFADRDIEIRQMLARLETDAPQVA